MHVPAGRHLALSTREKLDLFQASALAYADPAVKPTTESGRGHISDGVEIRAG
jgi:hypothetical protein